MSESRLTEIMESALIPLVALSSGTKPTSGVEKGQELFEYDTGRIFVYTGTDWVFKRNPDHLFSVTTIDLNQAAGAYDLFTVGASQIQVLEFGLVIPADLTGAAAGALTSVSVLSTDAVPLTLISSAAGAKANLTFGKHLLYSGGGIIGAAKKIQCTIAGGATTVAQVCNAWVKYQEVS